jgi:hypothetical protein
MDRLITDGAFYDDYHELVTDSRVDAVVVAGPAITDIEQPDLRG